MFEGPSMNSLALSKTRIIKCHLVKYTIRSIAVYWIIINNDAKLRHFSISP